MGLMGPRGKGIILLVILVAFGAGITKLFMLRFKGGDVYPSYSSLRSDPLGTRVFFESLKKMGNIRPQRNHLPLSRLERPGESALIFPGLFYKTKSIMDEKKLVDFERIAAVGGRVVISFLPMNWSSSKKEDEKIHAMPISDLGNRWGVALGLNYSGDEEIKALRAGNTPNSLPAQISWHTPLYFDLLKDNWGIVYQCNEKPVLIQRKFGMGTIVLASDSFFLSNEALSRKRNPGLLAWIVGPKKRVVFDELHFGVKEVRGVSGLAKKYKLQGLFWGIIILAGLFVWKNAIPFVPAENHEADNGNSEVSSGRDSTRGLVDLLRRNVPKKDILGVCVEEWQKSIGIARALPPKKMDMINGIAKSGIKMKKKKGIDPVSGYKRICDILESER